MGDAVAGVADKIKSFLGFSEPDEGPLSNFHTYMPDMIDLMSKGITAGKEKVRKALEGITGEMSVMASANMVSGGTAATAAGTSQISKSVVLNSNINNTFNGDQAIQQMLEAATRKPDLIILDLGLPDGDGIEFIRDLRQWSAVPVIVLSARSEESDKIAALDAGADDYLSKPFGIGELQARLRVALRRHSATTAPDPLVKFSDVTVDLAARVIHRGEEEVHLTPIEFRLLAVLLNNAGKVLTQRQLLNQVWGPNAVEHSHYLRIYMGHLRQKLEQDPARPRHFITETGIGYRFML